MAPSDYIFSTSQKEVMTIINGKLVVTLPDDVDKKVIRQVSLLLFKPIKSLK